MKFLILGILIISIFIFMRSYREPLTNISCLDAKSANFNCGLINATRTTNLNAFYDNGTGSTALDSFNYNCCNPTANKELGAEEGSTDTSPPAASWKETCSDWEVGNSCPTGYIVDPKENNITCGCNLNCIEGTKTKTGCNCTCNTPSPTTIPAWSNNVVQWDSWKQADPKENKNGPQCIIPPKPEWIPPTPVGCPSTCGAYGVDKAAGKSTPKNLTLAQSPSCNYCPSCSPADAKLLAEGKTPEHNKLLPAPAADCPTPKPSVPGATYTCNVNKVLSGVSAVKDVHWGSANPQWLENQNPTLNCCKEACTINDYTCGTPWGDVCPSCGTCSAKSPAGHWTCSPTTYKCVCADNWTGDKCDEDGSWEKTPGQCPTTCTAFGGAATTTVPDTWTCKPAGATCSQPGPTSSISCSLQTVKSSLCTAAQCGQTPGGCNCPACPTPSPAPPGPSPPGPTPPGPPPATTANIVVGTTNGGLAIGSGNNWTLSTGWGPIQAVASDGGTIVVGTTKGGLAIGSGNNWTLSTGWGPIQDVAISGSTIVVGTTKGGLAIGSGNNWTLSTGWGPIQSVAISGSTIVVGTTKGGLAIGSGNNWTLSTGWGPIQSVAISGSTIVVGTTKGGLAIGSGNNWTLSTGWGPIQSVAISGSTIVVGTTKGGLAIGKGDAWTLSTGWGPIKSVAISGSTIVVGTTKGGLAIGKGDAWTLSTGWGPIKSVAI